MYEISVKTRFSAAHRLRDYAGDCANVHGHNWEVVVRLEASDLDGLGIAMDFREVKKYLADVVAELDHTDLNTHPAFVSVNPTSERLARFIFDKMAGRIDNEYVRVKRVQVAENQDTVAAYFVS